MDSHSPKITGPVELLMSGWGLFRDHWKTLVPIIILPSIISYVGTGLQFVKSPVTDILSFILMIVGIVLSIASMPALINAIHDIRTGNTAPQTLQTRYKKGFSYFWSILLIGIIYFFVGLGSFVLLVVPWIIIGVYVFMYTYTLVIDNKRGFSALTESYSLVYGRWWPVFGRALFMVLASILIWFVIAGLAAILGALTGVRSEEVVGAGRQVTQTFGSFVLTSLLGIIGSAIMTPIVMGYTYELYTSLKKTRQADVSVVAIKRWLVTFLVVGIIVVPIATILGVVIGSKVAVKALSQNPQFQQELQRIMSEQKDPRVTEALNKYFNAQGTSSVQQ